VHLVQFVRRLDVPSVPELRRSTRGEAHPRRDL